MALFRKKRRKRRKSARVRYHARSQAAVVPKSAVARAATPKKKKEFTLKTKFEFFLFTTLLVVIFGILFYHPFFSIKTVEISGLQRIGEEEFRRAVFGILDYKKAYILPAKSYLISDTHELKTILNEKFPLQSIVVEKSFPNKLYVLVEEKLSTIIYDNGKKYSYVGLDGKIVEVMLNVSENEWNMVKKVNTTTLADGTIRTDEKIVESIHVPNVDEVKKQLGGFPILYDTNGDSSEVGEGVLSSKIVEGVINWFNFLERKKLIELDYMILNNQVGEGVIKTKEGWALKVNYSDSGIENRFDELVFVLDEKINKNKLEYIDLRYQERVYWKERE